MPAADPRDASSIAVVGAGPAGLAAALVLARQGLAVSLIGPPANSSDTRTTALLDGSLEILRGAGVDVAASGKAAPLRVMSIVDATQRLIRARPVAFRAAEIGLEAFGWNIPNADLNDLLEAAVSAQPGLSRLRTSVEEMTTDDAGATLRLAEGAPLRCGLVIAADGRNSQLRRAAGIEVETKTYPQTALTLNLRTARPHDDRSTEFHTEEGPFTLVPLPGQRVSLVWVMSPTAAERRASLDDEALAAEIERQCGSMLGLMVIDSRRSLWPMLRQSATSLVGPCLALVGEAGHTLPPIGAQGLNLTMRDIAALAAATAGAVDPGSPQVLEAYRRERRVDVASRGTAVDLLNRSLLSPILAAQGARSIGLYLLEQTGPLRRAVMREGLAGGRRA